MKTEHIGIAVKDIEAANKLFTRLFNQTPYKTEVLESENVITSFFQIGETKIELLEASSNDSVIGQFIDKRGEGIHHIAFEVTDIVAEMERMKLEGFQLINDKPIIGADNKLVCFVHPKSAGGILIELCQEMR